MHADVHKRTKIHHIAHRAGQFHPLLQIRHGQHIPAQHGLRQIVAQVAAGALQLRRNVAQRGFAHGKLCRKRRKALFLRRLQNAGHGAVLLHLFPAAAGRKQRARRRIALRVNGRAVQRLLTAHDAQEARALLKGLFAQFRHLQQLSAAAERAVFLSIGYNSARHSGAQPRNAAEQLARGCVQIHAHGIDAILHHAVQRLSQALLRHIVLILPHTDGLGIDLDQLRKGILQAPRDGHRRAQGYIVLREFCRSQRRG